MKKILMYGMSDDRGGIETYVMNVFRHMDRSQYEIWFTSACDQICFEHEIKALGGKIVHIIGSRHNYPVYKKSLNCVFRQKFDAIFFNVCDLISIDVLKCAKRVGVPVRVVHSHNAGRDGKMNLIHGCAEKFHRRYIKGYATDLWACSTVAGDWMFGKQPYKVISNGIDAEAFQYSKANGEAVRKEMGISENTLMICMVGRLTKQKNPLLALDIFAVVIKKRPESVLLVVGDGELKEAVTKRTEELGISKQVIIAGIRSDIPDVLSASNIYLMTSLYEGLPFVLVEAQASGLPCVVSDKVSDEVNITGLVKYVPLQASAETWADAILNASDSGRECAYEQVAQKGYDINSTVKMLEDIIEGITL